ncbi:MAG: VOC family protein [Acetobacteraceae bacterium]|nr:VOC family protein [Acetobacteraceae bacterium]
MSTALVLDHVGVCARDLGPMTAAYEALGFTLTPIARQSGKRTPDGPTEPFGTGNRCAFLRHGYIELLAILDPALFDNQLGTFLGRYHGLHICALGMMDEEGNLQRLRASGLDIPGIAWLERPVDDPDGPRARFARLPYPDAPEGRVQLIRHMTPELVWQDRWMDHANKAVALEELILVSDRAAESAQRLSQLSGLPVEPAAEGGYLLRLPGAPGAAGPRSPQLETRVRMLWPDALAAVLPGVAAPTLPFLAGMVIRTEDGNAAVGARLGDQLVPVPGGLMAPPAIAAGAAVVFAG